jgi:hypothetical protein|tara:strand:- start:568 stop:951 length:384 start_codon:yes stop_codon:yes gene_type:complete
VGLLSSAKYAILTNLPGGVTNVILYDRFGNEIANQAGDTAQDLYNDALDAGAKAIDKIEDVSLEVASAALDIIEGAGLAVISAGEKMYDYTYSKVAPHRVEAVTALTALTVYLTTAVIVFKKIKGAN